MPTITLTEKMQFIQAWKESGLSQEDFCASYTNIKPRTLRSWIQQARRPGDASSHARGVVLGLIEDLQALLATIEARDDAEEWIGVPTAEERAAAACLPAGAEHASEPDPGSPPRQEPPRRLAMPPAYTWVG